MDKTGLSRLFQSLKAVRRRKGKTRAILFLGIFALMVIVSMCPASGNAVSYSYTPFVPVKNFELAATTTEFIATAFTDSSGDWGSESNAYDGDWGTYADNVIFANGDDYPSAFASGFDGGASGSGTITQVDIVVRMSFASSSASDEWGITLDVGASTGNILWAMDKTPYSLANNTFTDVTEPNDATWSWAEIQAAEIHLDSNKVGGKDNDVWNVYEFAFKVTTEGGIPYSKDLTETVTVADVQTNAVDFARDLTEAVSAVDVSTTAADMARNLVESISVVGALIMLRGREKDLIETISVADVRTFAIDYVRDLVDSITVTEIWAKEFGLNRTEAISVVDGGTFSKFISKDMTEVIGVADSIVRSVDYSREMTETITGVDARTFSVDYALALVESINVVDIIDTVKSNGTDYEKDLTENINIFPDITTVGGETVLIGSMFYQLFLSLEMWGYLGPIALVIIGYVLTKKDKFLGVLWFVVECLFVAQYLALIEATPDYWWHIFILLLGGLFTCVYPLLDR